MKKIHSPLDRPLSTRLKKKKVRPKIDWKIDWKVDWKIILVNKYVNQKITPDILLEIQIQLSEDGQPIHWIDAKNHFVDPALSPDENVQSICRQMNKYVRTYGPGLIVWGRNFSEEWNDATKGNVQHIRIWKWICSRGNRWN